MNKKALSLLGLAKRAGKLITGEELTVKAIQNGKARLVFVASDAAAATTKRLLDKTHSYGVSAIFIYSAAELSQAIGQERKVLAVTDEGFAKKILFLLSDPQ